MAKTKSTTSKRQATRSRGAGKGDDGTTRPDTGGVQEGERELIVMTRPETGLRAMASGLESVAGVDVSSLSALLDQEGVSMRPLFGVIEERLRNEAASFAYAQDKPLSDVPDLSIYYKVDAPDERLDDLAEQLLGHEAVEAAYVKPPAVPAVVYELNAMTPRAEEALATPNFTARQGYLNPAPGGIDARYAWTLPGGSGAGVRIVDIEGAWRFTHEDLLQNQGGVVGPQFNDVRWRNHGTAVVGEIGGDRNSVGITGICPDANIRAVSQFGEGGTAQAIRQAANMLGPGDIILIEVQRHAGRRLDLAPIEWWPDDFDAVRYATLRGVIVVAAGANGSVNLDDPVFNTPARGFPSTWTNPFNRSNRDSGAIVVGAGAPPPGTHGTNIHGPDRSRLSFPDWGSNWGSMVDAQGWGVEVTTTGYGDLQGGTSEDLWYTDKFGGTSAASPIVVGALGCVQGVLRARSLPLLTPARARQLLRTTGSPQQDGPSGPATQRIGNRPNLRQLIAQAIIKPKEKFEGKEGGKDKLEAKETIKPEIKEQSDIKQLVQEKVFEGKGVQEVFGGMSGMQGGVPTGAAMSDQSSLLIMILERLENLEARLASGQPFISPEERPDVGGATVADEGPY